MIFIPKEKIILPTNDYIFKKIFGQVGNEEITKSLLNAILDEKVEQLELDCNPILEKELYNDKAGILDIKAKLNNNIMCDIEMQVADNKDIEKRILYYWSKLYISKIKSGEEYDKLNKTISILIADFELENLKQLMEYHTKFQIKETKKGKVVLTDMLEIHIIELPKIVYVVKEDLNKELLLWSKFIINPNSLEELDMKNNEAMKEAHKEYEKITEDEREMFLAEAREKARRDRMSFYTSGVQDGKEEGAQAEKESIAKKLLKKGMSVEKVMEITELSKNEIENL